MIHGDKLIELMEYSVNHPDLEKLFTEWNISKPAARQFPNYFQVDDVYLPNIGLWMRFTTAIGFPAFHGKEPPQVFTNDKWELILHEISFSDKSGEHCSYPFNLKFGDSFEETVRKLGTKPNEKRKAHPSGFVLYFFIGELELLIYTDDDKNLETLLVRIIDSRDKKRIELKKRIKEQTKLITTENIHKIKELTGKLPTESWRIRMSEGDTSFTMKSIELSETVLKEFIDLIADAVVAKKANKIIAAVKKVTSSFNKLNEKHDSFIETIEREELVEFIQQAVELTGFQLNGADITEEWREW